MSHAPDTPALYDQVAEPIIDPERPIVDPHHHLWYGNKWTSGQPYLLSDLWADTETGHNIQKTVYVECGSAYRRMGLEHLRPVGETAFVARIAQQSAEVPDCATIAGIVGHADLRQVDLLDEVLDAHEEAGQGLFRGIRQAGARHPNPKEAFGPGTNPAGLFLQPEFQAGVRKLGERGYTYESWHYHFQISDFTALARSAPNTVIILDHLGTPLGTRSYIHQRDNIYAQWKEDIAALAECQNVYAKLGGMAMPDNGYGWHEAETPITSDMLVSAQKHYYIHVMACFGAHRCMFESNFPVDKLSVGYATFWNACKKMTADFSEAEKDALFYSTAARVYRLE